MPKLRICVDQELCCAEVICTGISPKYFEMITNAQGEHKARMRAPGGLLPHEATFDVPDEDYDEVLDAAERCPPKAIIVTELHPDGREEQLCP